MFFPSPNIVVFSPSGVIKWGQICYTVTQKSTNNTMRCWRARVPGAVDMFLLSPALPPQHCNPEATKPYWLFTLKVFFLANGITEVQNCHHYVQGILSLLTSFQNIFALITFLLVVWRAQDNPRKWFHSNCIFPAPGGLCPFHIYQIYLIPWLTIVHFSVRGKASRLTKASPISLGSFFLTSFLEEATKFVFSSSQPLVLTQGSQSDTKGCVYVW